MARVEGSPDPGPCGSRAPLYSAPRAFVGFDTIQEAEVGGGPETSMAVTDGIAIDLYARSSPGLPCLGST